MELPFSCHPAEFSRRLKLIFEDLLTDLDLRFEDSRKRRLFELNSGEASPRLKNLLANTGEKTYSILDWSQLWEWNELWLQWEILHSIDEIRPTNSNSEVERAIFHRLSQMKSEMKTPPLSSEPSFWELLQYRWKNSALRDEARYLLKRFQDIRQAR